MVGIGCWGVVCVRGGVHLITYTIAATTYAILRLLLSFVDRRGRVPSMSLLISDWLALAVLCYGCDPAHRRLWLQVLATHSLFAPSADPSGYRLQLTLDVPSASTGTGGALLLDGRDVAMVRCAIVDSHANDALVATATNRITWAVTAGKGDPRLITPVMLAHFCRPNTASNRFIAMRGTLSGSNPARR